MGRHTTETAAEPLTQTPHKTEASHVTKDGVEIYGQIKSAEPAAAVVAPSLEQQEKQEEIEDDTSIPVPPGTVCKHNSCGISYKDDATSRGDGSEAVCTFHPGTPIFHEGSKGWTCCKRRVLEFDEFLKIPGCTKGKHVFTGRKKAESETEEMVDCRMDWYQTQTNVILSVFAKDKLDTQIRFQPRSVDIDIKMKNNKRFKKSLPLFHLIDPENSKFTTLSTKVEINLKKASGVSWAALEPTSNVKSWTTFGVTGGGGSVGAKEMHYVSDSPLHLKD